ncbi:unnamed protein product [Paramecium octaurelia]|uniref:UvrD-like helicase ATP-binding domain-containing protein n=1 Tax=Paramecium octaurelia TaxID=43137 RepID=A0A8S1S295_PAROT|nr:unnamed protein product [Paramecium octaurelia]
MKKMQNNQYREINSIAQIVKANQKIIQAELNQLLQQNSEILPNTSPNEFVKLWFELNAEERSKYILSGQHELSNFVQQELKSKFLNVNQILKAANFFDGVPWHYKITNKFTQNACIISQHYMKVLAYIKTILQGYFSMIDQVMTTTVIDMEPLSNFQAYFQTKTEEGFTLFWEVAIDKVPKLVCQNMLNIKQIVGFNFYHTITFIDIKQENIHDKDIKLIIQNYHIDTKSSYYRKGIDYSKLKCEDFENESNKCYLFMRSTNNNNSYWELNYNLMKYDIIKWLSHQFQPIFLNKQEQTMYQFDASSQKWISKFDEDILQNESQIQQEKIFKKDLVQKFADFTISSKLVEFLQKVPNFSIKLTDEQKQIIGMEGKIIFGGRSGTGKTTCLILRLLAMKHIFKLRIEVHQKKNPSIEIDDLYFNCLFISNNNILSIQAKKYYEKLNNQVQAELNKNKQKRNYQNSQNLSWTQGVQQVIYPSNIQTQGQQNDQQDYPLFLTIYQLIFRIDSYLNKPYFPQNQSQQNLNNYNIFAEDMAYQFTNLFLKQDINQEGEINLNDLIQQQSFKEQKNIENKTEKQNRKEEQKQLINHQEVDFTFFLNNFWLKKCSNVQLNPHFVWTYIYSYIKGCSNAHEYPGHYISKSTFLSMFSNNKEFNTLYDIFIQYEKWRADKGYYDLLDVVNHILVQLKQDEICMPQIHYLIIDEIQDLPEAMILLFEKVSLFGTIYSGDTAQNISKGVGFRFLTMQELSKRIYQKEEYQYYQTEQFLKTLNQNFRSNSNILKLANSIVSLIQMYFPKTIDDFMKESSNFKGVKPIIVNGSLDLLFYLFEGLDNSEISEEIQKQPIELGFRSVIIVKNKEQKKNIPKLLQHIQVLSIEEVKGLEFENVILYNFFTDSIIKESEWKLLQTCEVIDEEMNKQAYLTSLTRQSTIDYYTSYFTGYDDKNGNILFKRMIPYIKYYDEFTYSNSGLCNELKQLYIATTRSRQCLYIFDEKPQQRRWIEQIWKSLQLIEIVDQINFEHQNLQANLQIKSKFQWKEQGKIMFQKQLYEQAEKCFQFSEEEILCKKAKGFRLATEGCQLILSFQQQSQQYLKLKDKNQKISELKQQYQVKLQEAAQLFQDTLNFRQAAQCLYFCEQYDQAFKIYASLELFQEAGEAAYKSENYIQAAKFFLKCKDVTKTIDSYEQANEFEQILQFLYQQKDKINDAIRTEFINKYFPIFLKKLTIEFENKQKYYCQQSTVEDLARKFIMSQKDIEEDRYLNNNRNPIELKNQSENSQFELNDQFNFEEDSLFEFQFDLKKYKELQNENEIKEIDFGDYSIINPQRECALKSNIQCKNSNLKSIQDQDSVITKLFKYIAMFSIEFQKSLLKNSNYQQEKQSKNQIQFEFLDQADDQLINLDSIDQSQILYVLDVLNQFKNYKLCIFICNRYSMQDHLIKYLSKIATFLSPLSQQQSAINTLNQSNQVVKEKQIQKGQVASLTLHQIFQMIDPKFLIQQIRQEDIIPSKYLVTDFHSLLILLGYWKKVIYQLDFENSQSVSSLFMDFKSWKYSYWMNVIEQLNKTILSTDIRDPQLENIFLIKLQRAKQNLNLCLKKNSILFEELNFDQPLNYLDIQYCIIHLEQYYDEQITQLTANYKIPQWLYFRKSTLNLDTIEKNEINHTKHQIFIYQLSEEIFRSVLNETKLNNQIINELIQRIEFQNPIADYIQLFQSVYLILFYCEQILYNKPYQQINRVENINCKQYGSLMESLNSIIRVFNSNQDNLQKHRQIIKRSIFSYFKVREPDNNNLLHPFMNSLIIHGSSIILEEIIQQKESENNVFFADIELNFVLAPRVLIVQIITKKLHQIILDLNDARKKCVDEFNPKYSIYFIDKFGIHNYYQQDIKGQNTQQQLKKKQDMITDGIQKHSKQLFKNSTIQEFHKRSGLLKLLLKNPYLKCNSKDQKFCINYEGLYQLANKYQNSSDLHCQMIKSIILLNHSNCNHFTYLFLNNKILQGCENQYSKYLEFLNFTLYKQWNMIDKATLSFFNYLSMAKDEITVEELIYNLIFLFLQNIVGQNLNFKDRCLINIPNSYVIYFDKINEKKGNNYCQQIALLPVQNQENLGKILDQLINVNKLNPTLKQKKIQQLIYILLINLDEISQETIKLISCEILQNKDLKFDKGLYDQLLNVMNQPLQIRTQFLLKNENVSKFFKVNNNELICIEFEKQTDLKLLEKDSKYQIKLQAQCEMLKTQTKKIFRAYRIHKYSGSTFFTIPKFSYGEYPFTTYFKVSQFINLISICMIIRGKLISTFYQSTNQEVDVIFKNINQFKQLQEIENQYYNQYLSFESKNISKLEFFQYRLQYRKKCHQIYNKCDQINELDYKVQTQNILDKNQQLE